MRSRNHVRRRKRGETQGRKNTSNTCTSPSCYCEAPSRLTQAVAAGKPERMQIYPHTVEFASKNLRPRSVRKKNASHRLPTAHASWGSYRRDHPISVKKHALRTQHQVSRIEFLRRVFSPGENAQFRDLNHSRTSHRSHVLYQGTAPAGPYKTGLMRPLGPGARFFSEA
jgi:hypothetical protein